MARLAWPRADYEKLAGDVAQLVERRNGIAEVTGSTPVVSTKPLFSDVRGMIGPYLQLEVTTGGLVSLIHRSTEIGWFGYVEKRDEDQGLQRPKRG